MKKRFLVAGIGPPALLAVYLLLPKWVGALVFAIACGMITRELLKPTGYAPGKRVLWISAIFSAGVSLRSFTGGSETEAAVGITLYVLYLLVELLFAGTAWQFGDMCAVLFGGLLLPWLLSATVRIYAGETGRALVLLPFALTMAPDGGALGAGILFGKHPLAPEISPKKTVEGAIGSVLAGILTAYVYGLVLHLLGYRVSWGAAALYGFLGGLFSVLGDLVFSTIKRQRGIKDFSRVLSEHGGMLDRFDSLVLFAPVAELLMRYVPFCE